MKIFITIYVIIVISIISFISGLFLTPQTECSEKEEYYIYYKNEKLYIPKEVKPYIKQLQTKGEDRLKSKRGIFKN